MVTLPTQGILGGVTALITLLILSSVVAVGVDETQIVISSGFLVVGGVFLVVTLLSYRSRIRISNL
ncbi:hypothetical protein CLV82_1761 [Zeaxanthinibacter enoshimensis]|uniref:Uncharacterized protein n=1 Tax=Zeaxanthinibacter enoshimensis TaxID=392009 RepID=A0A4R6TRE3_9FLAO|nr:hypothetical protein CLV82_1761 [Zeaxanthinibacter enoshimensis]